LETGLPDFSWCNIPKRGKLHQLTTKLPIFHTIYHLVVIYFKLTLNVRIFSIIRPTKFYPNKGFGLKLYHLATLFGDKENKGPKSSHWRLSFVHSSS
jgi:hypothetical protein